MTLNDLAARLTNAGIDCTLTESTLQSNIHWYDNDVPKQLSLFITQKGDRYTALINTPVYIKSSGLTAEGAVQLFIQEKQLYRYQIKA